MVRRRAQQPSPSGTGAGFASTDHQKTRRLTFKAQHGVSRGRGANLSSWNDREEMVFANNVVYRDGGDALRFPNGSRGVTIAGNVVVGRASGVDGGFLPGRGLEDFEGVTWDGEKRNASPRKGSRDGAGDARRVRSIHGPPAGKSVIAGADTPRSAIEGRRPTRS
jgi:hypothetical protein